MKNTILYFTLVLVVGAGLAVGQDVCNTEDCQLAGKPSFSR